MARVGALVVAAVVAAGCGSSFAATSPSANGGSGVVEASALPAGTYTSKAFLPALTYTLPAGWDSPADAGDFFQLRPAGSQLAGIYLFREPQAASQDPSCPQTAVPGVGTSPKELAVWMRTLPGLVVSDPVPVTIGGLTGVSVDIGIADGWTASCPFANGVSTVPLFVGVQNDFRWVIAGSEQLRMALLDSPQGTVVVDVDAFDGGLIDALLTEADPIVKSMVFASP
jgi:hypothetical protein